MVTRAFLLLALCFALTWSAQAQNTAKKLTPEVMFVQQMADTGISFLADTSLTLDQRQQEFQGLLKSYFDIEAIARFAIGKYWKTMNDEEKEHYLQSFEDYLLNVYSRRFQDYKGQSFEVQKSIAASSTVNNDTLVTSFLVPDSGPAIQVDWRIREKDGEFKVIDIIVSGVSMAITQRSDFSSVIQRSGGHVKALLNHLEKQPLKN